jgi:plastocyanin
MFRIATRARVLVIGAAFAVGSFAVGVPVAASAQASPPTWDVQAGNGDFQPGHPAQEITAFYPARVVVNAGDDIRFTPLGGHTVTFNPVRPPGVPTFAYADPAFGGFGGDTLHLGNRPGGAPLSSGDISFLPNGYTLHIASDAAGSSRTSAREAEGESGTTYQYFCMFHRNMTGWITVLPAGAEPPSTNARNQEIAQLAIKADIALGQHIFKRAQKNVEDNQVAAGLGASSVQDAGAISVLRFGPETIEINTGDSVTFVNKDINAPHTVTFGTEIPNPFAPGFTPYGGTTISSPSDQVNSGFLVSQELVDYINVGSLIQGVFPGFVITRQVTFKFTKSGVFPYFCALHDTLGMVGTVIVRDEGHND